jgi:hypothetical protein
MTLVRRAKELKDEADENARRERDDNLLFEEVWCVFDVDEHPHISEARAFAISIGLRIAMSNPCFELWLLLHLRDSPGPQHRHHLQRMLSERMSAVESKHVDFELLVDGYEDAVRRSELLERDAIEANERGRNPSTEVHHLTNSIDQDGFANRIAPTKQKAR